jgi:hypothetical protein
MSRVDGNAPPAKQSEVTEMAATEYTIEITISLEENSQSSLIERARRVYRRRGAATLPNRRQKPIRSEEFVDGPETALIELAEANPLFGQAGVHLIRVGCGPSNGASTSQSHARQKSAVPDIYLR